MTQVCEELVRSFEAEGAVCVRAVFDSDQVGLIGRTVREEIAHLEDSLRTNRPPTRILGTTEPGMHYLEHVADRHPEVRAAVLGSGIARIAGALTGSRAIRFWRDEVYYKLAESAINTTPWHTDIGAIPFAGRQVVIAWTALSTTTADSAAIRTIVGSHRVYTKPARPPRGREAIDLLDGYIDLPDFDALIAGGEVEERVWPMQPGDVLLFHANTVHGARPNRGSTVRIGYTTTWLGDDVVWRPDPFSVDDPRIGPADLDEQGRPIGSVLPICWREERVPPPAAAPPPTMAQRGPPRTN